MDLTFIRIPLYKLNYVSSIDEIKLDEDFLTQYRNEYDTEERANIFEQLDWATKNPNYDFRELMANDKFTNKEIYTYIQRLRDFIKEKDRF